MSPHARLTTLNLVSESVSGGRARLFVPGFLPDWLVNAGPLLLIMLPAVVLIATGDDGWRFHAVAAGAV